jgi:hypothetical protein
LGACRTVAKEDDVRRHRSIGERIDPDSSDDRSQLVAYRHGTDYVDVLHRDDTPFVD